ncbi:hypothetical protein NECAME_05574 [Necator americanus]|uniref:Uncharacterized protein n=1 Tax=Necator americanus TaxID=51031 RepID=W2SHY9_NECAM|nr:hypothetical protein NECAME_05574 [Necator americanus]ETN68491.1 hypothetical protein NECAME_05574 [Necator americanus]
MAWISQPTELMTAEVTLLSSAKFRCVTLKQSSFFTLKFCTGRKIPGNVSGRMEIEGITRLLQWVVGQGMIVRSLTTDRSRSIAKFSRDLKEEVDPITMAGIW